VTDSHHWLKADRLFPSNFPGFSIFSLEVGIWGSFTGGSRTAAIPAPTSLAISSRVSMVASCALMGSLVFGGGLRAGRFWVFRSSSYVLGSGEGEGDPAGRLGPGGIPPPLPPVPPVAGHGGSSVSGGLDGGSAGRLCLHKRRAGMSRMGLWSAGCLGSGGNAAGAVGAVGVVGAVAALVLEGRIGLHQCCNGSRDGRLVAGESGRGT